MINQEVARRFFDRMLKQAQEHLSDEHFAVDGTLIQAWASQKKDGGDDGAHAGKNDCWFAAWVQTKPIKPEIWRSAVSCRTATW